ncbi:hypothetical protein ELI_4311 [Eubacterium callanderi]|uniref:Uncharacterized protein n=1 Tax=Eubacterium callanderi TaxID=53442 RepID=E3GQF9_9FIRM|nr:hypothetical protein ELI_4311 [Eubacterium callanderi]
MKLSGMGGFFFMMASFGLLLVYPRSGGKKRGFRFIKENKK